MKAIQNLQQCVVSATHQNMQQPDMQVYNDIKNLVNQRADLPKVCIEAITKRMIIKNPKVELLTYDLLEFLTINCGQPFYNAVSEKNFLMRLGTVLGQSDRDQMAKKRLLATIYVMAQTFNNQNQSLFFQFYSKQLEKGVQFPNNYNSCYGQVQNPNDVSAIKPSQTQKPVQQPQQNIQPVNIQRLPQPKQQYTQEQTVIRKDGQKTPYHELKDNVVEVNKLIDQHDVSKPVQQNFKLCSLFTEVMKSQDKLQDLILKTTNEDQLNKLILTNEDILKTKERYEDIRNFKKPKSFREDVDADTLRQIQEIERMTTSTMQHDNFFGGGGNVVQENNSQIQDNLLDLDFGGGQQVQQVQQSNGGNQELFDILGDSQPIQSQQQQQPQQVQQVQQSQDVNSLANDILGLEFGPPTQEPQQQKQQTGNYDSLLMGYDVNNQQPQPNQPINQQLMNFQNQQPFQQQTQQPFQQPVQQPFQQSPQQQQPFNTQPTPQIFNEAPSSNQPNIFDTDNTKKNDLDDLFGVSDQNTQKKQQQPNNFEIF